MPSAEQTPRTMTHCRIRSRKSAATSAPAATSGIAPAPGSISHKALSGGTAVNPPQQHRARRSDEGR